jgi:adenylate kinase
MNLSTIVFIGRSGSGKGTQIEKLIEYLEENDNRKIFTLQAGKHIRNFIKKNTYSASLSNEINESGGLQPEFISIWAWGEEILKNLKEDEHILIDGAPRRVDEAKVLESLFDFYGRSNINTVYLNTSRECAKERLIKRRREDDIELSDIENRLDWFETDVAPVIDYYRSHKIHHFHEINGEQEIDKIHEDILKSLEI